MLGSFILHINDIALLCDPSMRFMRMTHSDILPRGLESPNSVSPPSCASEVESDDIVPSPHQVADGLEPSHPDSFKYCNIHVGDSPTEDLVAHFPKCFAFIDEALSQHGGLRCKGEKDWGGRLILLVGF